MKKNQVNVRLDEGLKEALDQACEVTGLDPSTVVRACVQAFVEKVEEDGEIRLPLALISKREAAVKKSSALSQGSTATPPGGSRVGRDAKTHAPGLNEDPGAYKSKRGRGFSDLQPQRSGSFIF